MNTTTRKKGLILLFLVLVIGMVYFINLSYPLSSMYEGTAQKFQSLDYRDAITQQQKSRNLGGVSSFGVDVDDPYLFLPDLYGSASQYEWIDPNWAGEPQPYKPISWYVTLPTETLTYTKVWYEDDVRWEQEFTNTTTKQLLISGGVYRTQFAASIWTASNTRFDIFNPEYRWKWADTTIWLHVGTVVWKAEGNYTDTNWSMTDAAWILNAQVVNVKEGSVTAEATSINSLSEFNSLTLVPVAGDYVSTGWIPTVGTPFDMYTKESDGSYKLIDVFNIEEAQANQSPLAPDPRLQSDCYIPMKFSVFGADGGAPIIDPWADPARITLIQLDILKVGKWLCTNTQKVALGAPTASTGGSFLDKWAWQLGEWLADPWNLAGLGTFALLGIGLITVIVLFFVVGFPVGLRKRGR